MNQVRVSNVISEDDYEPNYKFYCKIMTTENKIWEKRNYEILHYKLDMVLWQKLFPNFPLMRWLVKMFHVLMYTLTIQDQGL